MAAEGDQPGIFSRINYDTPVPRRIMFDKSLRMTNFAMQYNFRSWHNGDTDGIPTQIVKGDAFDEFQRSYGPSYLFSSNGSYTHEDDTETKAPVVRISSHSNEALSWKDRFDGSVCIYVMPANRGIPMQLPVDDAISNRGKRVLIVLDVAEFPLEEVRENFNSNHAVSGAIYYKYGRIDPTYNGEPECRITVEPVEPVEPDSADGL